MDERKVTILESVVEDIVRIAMFVESKGFPEAAKKFVVDCFDFFENLNIKNVKYRKCEY